MTFYFKSNLASVGIFHKIEFKKIIIMSRSLHLRLLRLVAIFFR